MMTRVNRLFLQKKVALMIGILMGILLSTSAKAFDVVWDPGNAAHNSVTAAQSLLTASRTLQQVNKQIQQYELQVQQYKNMVKNITSPNDYTFDQVEMNINMLITAIDTLKQYKEQLGLDNYLSKYKDMNYYKTKCFNKTTGCSSEEWRGIKQTQTLGFEAQKKANDAMLKSVDQHQTGLKNDSKQLTKLQSSTKSADGHMKAIQHTNQLASYQSHQMLQIRGLMVAQQNAEATRAQAEADRKSQESAASEQVRQNSFKPSQNRNW